jgi:hypothetical protein
LHFFHFLTQEKIGFKLSEIMVGSRIQGSKRYRIPDPDPQHCLELSVGNLILSGFFLRDYSI